MDAVAGGQRVGEALENHDAAALAAHEAVGRGVEGFAAPVGGHHAALRKRDAGFGHQDDVHARRNGKVAIPAAQVHAGEVGRHQGRGTGGIDGEAGSLKPQHVGQAPRGDAVRHAGGVVGIDEGPVARLNRKLRVVAVADPQEHAGRER